MDRSLISSSHRFNRNSVVYRQKCYMMLFMMLNIDRLGIVVCWKVMRSVWYHRIVILDIIQVRSNESDPKEKRE